MNNCLYIIYTHTQVLQYFMFNFLQISIDDAILPGADGKIVAWVEED